MSILGERIRLRRKYLGLTQDELAKKMGYRSRSSVNKIEIGENDIPQSKIVKFAKVLDATPSYLMGWTDNPREFVIKEPLSELPLDIKLLVEARKQSGFEFAKIVERLHSLISEEDILMFEKGYETLDPEMRELYADVVGVDLKRWQLHAIEVSWADKRFLPLCPVNPSLPKYHNNEEAFISDVVKALIIEKQIREEEEDFLVEFFDTLEEVGEADRPAIYSQLKTYLQFLKSQVRK